MTRQAVIHSSVGDGALVGSLRDDRAAAFEIDGQLTLGLVALGENKQAPLEAGKGLPGGINLRGVDVVVVFEHISKRVLLVIDGSSCRGGGDGGSRRHFFVLFRRVFFLWVQEQAMRTTTELLGSLGARDGLEGQKEKENTATYFIRGSLRCGLLLLRDGGRTDVHADGVRLRLAVHATGGDRARKVDGCCVGRGRPRQAAAGARGRAHDEGRGDFGESAWRSDAEGHAKTSDCCGVSRPVPGDKTCSNHNSDAKLENFRRFRGGARQLLADNLTEISAKNKRKIDIAFQHSTWDHTAPTHTGMIYCNTIPTRLSRLGAGEIAGDWITEYKLFLI